MSISIEAIEAKIKQFEGELTAAVTNHAMINGAITGLKLLLNDAKEVADVIAPSSPVTEVLDVVDEVVNAVSEPQS